MKRSAYAILTVLYFLAVFGCEPSKSPVTKVPVTAAEKKAEKDIVAPPVTTPSKESSAPKILSPATEPFAGYSLFSPLRSTDTFLVNMNKEVVHQWKSEFPPGGAIELLDNGDLIRCTRDPDYKAIKFHGGQGSKIQRFDWNGNLIWDFEYANDQYCIHHDIELLPNGNILMIAWEKKTKDEAIAAGRDPKLFSENQILPEKIIEVKPTGPKDGEIVWEWHMWDHLVQDFDKTKPNYKVVYASPELLDINNVGSTPILSQEELSKLRAIGYAGGGDGANTAAKNQKLDEDWIHMNAIDYNPTLDQIVVSAKHWSEIWIIDHSTTTAEAASHKGGKRGKGGDILYRWGNPWSYKSGTLVDKQLFDQHDVRWIPKGYPGEGHLTAFNNGLGRPGEYSSVIEIVPPIDAKGNYILDEEKGTFGPEKPVWEFTNEPKKDFYSGFISGAARLPNGNTLICEGVKGFIFEVNSEGKKLWEFAQPFGGERGGSDGKPVNPATASNARGPVNMTSLFRATRYATGHSAFKGKKLEPMNPQPVPFSQIAAEAKAKADAEKAAAAEKAATAVPEAAAPAAQGTTN